MPTTDTAHHLIEVALPHLFLIRIYKIKKIITKKKTKKTKKQKKNPKKQKTKQKNGELFPFFFSSKGSSPYDYVIVLRHPITITLTTDTAHHLIEVALPHLFLNRVTASKTKKKTKQNKKTKNQTNKQTKKKKKKKQQKKTPPGLSRFSFPPTTDTAHRLIEVALPHLF
jgi:hypothetical protein